jgi:hypothetical protein
MFMVAAAAACVLIGGVAAQPAAAQGKPEIVKSPKFTDTFVLDDRCQGFSVRVDIGGTQGVRIFFSDAEFIIAGSLKATFTRLLPDGSDGPSVSFNISGPGRINVDAGLIYGHGPWEFDRGDDPATPQWEGEIILANGNLVYDINTMEVVSSTVPVRDICAELA